MKRTEAANLLDELRVAMADEANPHSMPGKFLAIFKKYNVSPLTICNGEAHSNPYIDNCGVCAPRWGFKGEKIEIT